MTQIIEQQPEGIPVDKDGCVPESALKHKDIEQGAYDDEGSSTGSLEEIDDSRVEKEKVVIATNETKRVGYLRLILMLVLACVAGSVSFVVYWVNEESEDSEFEAYARESCRKVVSNFQASAARRVGTIESFATSIASNAAAQGETWPNVTVPDFEKQASMILDLAEVMSLILIPLITQEEVEGWSEYAKNNQGWFNESLEYQAATGTAHNLSDPYVLTMHERMGHPSERPGYAIREVPWRGRNRTALNSTVEGPFMPWWQWAPVWPNSGVVGMDLTTGSSRKHEIRAMLEMQEPIVSTAFDYSEGSGKNTALNLYLKRWKDSGRRYDGGPASDLYIPVFERSSKRLVGALTAYVYWQAYLFDILPTNSQPVIVVLENSCGKLDENLTHYLEQQFFSYEVRGEDAFYLGDGDLHAPKYDHLRETTGWNAFLAGSQDPKNLMDGQCIYNVHVYPSKEMEDSLSTYDPLYFMLVVLSTFIFTSLIFVLYDYYVERRQKVVMNKAIKSTEVVQELFPENVRDRLFDESDEKTSQRKNRVSKLSFLSDDSTEDQAMPMSLEEHTAGRAHSAAVADLYENCSVLFADIAGFTQWSSTREPSAIFELLETLYGAFDRLAKRRGVFKVETIGDCYLAITGVPRPQKDHAVILAKFAGDCLEKMNHVVHSELVDSLGEETAQLKLRVGIHSGPVTAGVLRGERARFQLFGDTVNTASRMESTSLAGMIQVTCSTAEIIRASHRGHWLTPREGGVEAKGKGRMETFWLHPKHSPFTASVTSCSIGQSRDSDFSTPEGNLNGSTEIGFSLENGDSNEANANNEDTADVSGNVYV